MESQKADSKQQTIDDERVTHTLPTGITEEVHGMIVFSYGVPGVMVLVMMMLMMLMMVMEMAMIAIMMVMMMMVMTALVAMVIMAVTWIASGCVG
jgi:hypothetical protein